MYTYLIQFSQLHLVHGLYWMLEVWDLFFQESRIIKQMSHPYEEHPYLSSMIQLHSNTTILEMSSRMRTITEHPAIISDDM